MVIRSASEMRTFRVGVTTQHMQVCLWFFYFMYLNPRRIHQIASWQLKMSFCKVAMKLVLRRCFLPRKFVILVSGLPACLT